jgi:hypothetical protein
MQMKWRRNEEAAPAEEESSGGHRRPSRPSSRRVTRTRVLQVRPPRLPRDRTEMNTLVSRFSVSGPEAELRKARAIAVEDGEFEDGAWGSAAGFGSLAHGVPAFGVPAVPDVRAVLYYGLGQAG